MKTFDQSVYVFDSHPDAEEEIRGAQEGERIEWRDGIWTR